MKKHFIPQLFIAVMMLSWGLSGCATVKVSMPGIPGVQAAKPATPVSERIVLVNSVSELSNTPWPQPDEKSIQARMVLSMFGRDDNEVQSMTKAKAQKIYLLAVREAVMPAQKVLSDSDKCLARARDVAEAGRQAVTAINAEREDVVVLEKAISTVRETRDMYVSVLKTLYSEDSAQISKSEIKETKAAFTQTMRDIGRTADVLADRVAAGKANRQYASPRSEALE